MNQIGLGFGCPHGIARPFAVAVTWSIKNDDTITVGSHGDQAARFEILNHAAVAVQEHERLTNTPLDIMQANIVHIDEFSGRRIVALRFSGQPMIHDRADRKGRTRDHRPNGVRVRLESGQVRAGNACGTAGERRH